MVFSFKNMNAKNNIVIISGPSGAGEDSVIQGLEKLFPTERVITTTTRPMRVGESEGKPYHFISKEIFQKKIAAGEFFEYAEEDNHQLYGVTLEEIHRAQNVPKMVLWKMDYKGVITIKKLLPEVLCILVTAPLEVLEQRIRQRDVVTEEFVRDRMEYAKGWFKNRMIFDYEVENIQGKLDETVAQVANYIRQHSLLP